MKALSDMTDIPEKINVLGGFITEFDGITYIICRAEGTEKHLIFTTREPPLVEVLREIS